MKKPDVVVAFAFSKEGKANWDIGCHAEYVAKKHEIPLFTQKDVSKHLKPSSVVIFNAEEKEKYLSTLGIVNAFKKMAETKNWRTVFVVAAPCHIERCCRDLKRVGFHIVTSDYFKVAYIFSFWYNSKDSQIWVRNPIIWWFREIILRLMPWKLYSKIAA